MPRLEALRPLAFSLDLGYLWQLGGQSSPGAQSWRRDQQIDETAEQWLVTSRRNLLLLVGVYTFTRSSSARSDSRFGSSLLPLSSRKTLDPRRREARCQGLGMSAGLVYAASTLLADADHRIESWTGLGFRA